MLNPHSMRYVTLSGLPLRFDFTWPFRAAEAGSDWFVVHGIVGLDDGGNSGLQAEVAVNMSQTIREALPSLGGQQAEAVAVNAVRKAVDHHLLEFLKSGKRQPVQLSSRNYDFRTRKFSFAHPTDEEVVEFLKRKVFWLRERVWVPDPYDGQYLDRGAEELGRFSQQLADTGWMDLDGEMAAATELLRSQAERFEAEKQRGLAAAAGRTKVSA